jgi:hypothetical protein
MYSRDVSYINDVMLNQTSDVVMAKVDVFGAICINITDTHSQNSFVILVNFDWSSKGQLDGGVDVHKCLDFPAKFTDGHIFGFGVRERDGGCFSRFLGDGCSSEGNQIAELRTSSMMDVKSGIGVTLEFPVTCFTVEKTKRRG